jgi:DNA modification methylase
MLSNVNAIDFLQSIPDNSVDLVLVDPPYFIGFDGGKGWDSQWNSEQEYLDWCASWTTECVRVLKPNRMFVCFGTLKTDTFLRYKLDVLNSHSSLCPQNELIWSYNWGGRSKSNFARKHEYAWCYSKGKSFLFNGDDVRVPRKLKTNIRTGLPFERGTIPTCIWEFNNHTTSADFCGWHPTTKNLDVLTRIIKAYTNTNDLVLDCFMGSGSTAIAATRSNRQWIGSELDTDYYTKALDRINSSTNANTL